MRRWSALVAATMATLLLSGGVAFAADRLASPGSSPAPQLKTIPSATVARLGISLSPATLPPYCGGLEQTAVDRGWVRPGSAGCTISRDVAERAARAGSRITVVESLLARVSGTRPSSGIGKDQLTWLVVVQSSFGVTCAQPQPQGAASACFRRGGNITQLVLVDAFSGSVITTMNVNQLARVGQPARPLPVAGG